MEDRETPRMRKYGERKTTRIMMSTVPHVTAWAGRTKYHADGFFFRMSTYLIVLVCTDISKFLVWRRVLKITLQTISNIVCGNQTKGNCLLKEYVHLSQSDLQNSNLHSLFVGVCLDVEILFLLMYACMYIGCPRRNVPDFGRVFLMLKYTDITQNTYVQSWTVTEI